MRFHIVCKKVCNELLTWKIYNLLLRHSCERTVNNLSSQYIYISHNIVGKQYYKILDIDIMSMLYTVVEKTSKIYSNKNDICIKNIGTWNISYLINLIYFYFIFCLDWNKNFVFKYRSTSIVMTFSNIFFFFTTCIKI